MTVRLVIQWKRPGPPPVVVASPAAVPEASSEKRFHERLPVNHKFSIYSDDAKGGHRSVVARGINMSKSGALVEMTEPLAIGTSVYIKTKGLGLMGMATVRHCTAKGSKFRIGLHFPSALTRCL